MSEVEIDLLTDYGTASYKDARVRRIYNEEPNNNGLCIESILSTLNIKSEDTFTTSVSGNIIVGATGYYDADLETYWDITAGTSACINVGSDFCLSVDGLYDVDVGDVDVDVTGSADWNMGVSACIHTGTELCLDVGTQLDVDATTLDADFTSGTLDTGTSFAITAGTDLGLNATQDVNIVATRTVDIDATDNIELGATQIHLVAQGDVCVISDHSIGITAYDHLYIAADNHLHIDTGQHLKINVTGLEEHNIYGDYLVNSTEHIEIDAGTTMILESEDKMYIRSITDGICLAADGGDLDMTVTGANLVQTTDSAIDINAGTTTTVDANDVSIGATNCVTLDAGCIALDSSNDIDIVAPQLQPGTTEPIGTNGCVNITTGCFDVDFGTTATLSGPSLVIDVANFELGVTQLELCDGSFLGSTGSASLPTFSFCDDQNTGMYSPASDEIALSTAGTEKIRIDSSGYLGIGTNNPTVTSHIRSGGNALPATSGTTPSTGTVQRIDGNDNIVLDIGRGGTGVWLQATHKSDLSLTEEILINPNGGNVGIGTDTPGTTLHVRSGGNALPATSGTTPSAGTVQRIDGNDNIVLDIGRGGTGVWLQATHKSDLSLTEEILINPNGGNVGINTSSPAAGFHTYDVEAIVSKTSTTAFTVERLDGHDCFVVDTTNCETEVTGAIHVYGTSRVQVTDANAFVVEKATGEDCFVVDTTDCSATFSGPLSVNNADTTITTDSDTAFIVSGSTEACFIVDTLSCEITLAGQVHANNFSVDNLGVTSMGVTGDLTVHGGIQVCNQQLEISDGSAAAPGIAFCSDLDVGIFRPTTNEMGFSTSGAERMRIDASGFVGIGTADPGFALHIYEDKNDVSMIRLVNPNTGTGAHAMMSLCNDISGDPCFRFGAMGKGFTTTGGLIQNAGILDLEPGLDGGLSILTRSTAATAHMRFYTGGISNERMRIEKDGNVGIGTQTISSKFHVYGTSRVQVTDTNAFVVEKATGEDCFVIDTTDCSATFDGPLNVNDNVTITNSSPTALVVEGSTGVDCLVVDTQDCKVSLDKLDTTGDVTITNHSQTALVVEGVTGVDCLVVDTTACAITVSGSLTVSDVITDTLGISGDLNVAGNLAVTGTASFCANQVEIMPGSASTPGLSFCGDPDTGLFQSSGEHIAIATNGVERMEVDNNGNVVFDTNTLYIDAVNNRIGSGTVSPSVDFEINKSKSGAHVHALLKNTSNTAGSNAYVQLMAGGASAGDPALIYTIDGVLSYRTGIDNDDNDNFKISSGDVFNSNFIMDTSGNIGIGSAPSTSTGADLYLYRSGSNAELHIERDSGAFMAIKAQDTQSRFVYESGPLYFDRDSAGTDTMVLDASGNVGIGTDNPSNRLHVYDGDFRVTNTANEALLIERDDGHDCFVVNTTTCTTGVSGSFTVVSSSANAILVQGEDKVPCFNVAADTCAVGVTGDSTISTVSSTAFVVQTPLQEECFVVDTTSCAVTVGGLLTVDNLTLGDGITGDLNISGNLAVTGTADFCASPVRFSDGSAAAPALTFCDDLDTGIYSSGSDEVSVATGGAQRMVVNASGNVGIGTNSPSNRLHVYQSTASDSVLQISNSACSSSGLQLYTSSSCLSVIENTENTDISIQTNSLERMRILADGTVGIGTASTSSTHHVYGTSRVQVTDANAFVVEKATGEDCFVVDTTDCSATFNGPVEINSDASNALQVLNSDGTTLLNVNGLNDTVGITGTLDVSAHSSSAFVVQGITGDDCLVVDTVNCSVNIPGTLNSATIGVSGDLTVNGNLTVHGTETVLNTETLTVDDNKIILNGITSPDDTTADDGGIELHGDAIYGICWDKDCIHTGYGVTASWTFNQNISISDTLGYYIDCKVHHDQENIVVNTRKNSHAGAMYLSTNDILTPADGDWRIATRTNTNGKEVLEFQRYNGSVWERRMRIN